MTIENTLIETAEKSRIEYPYIMKRIISTDQDLYYRQYKRCKLSEIKVEGISLSRQIRMNKKERWLPRWPQGAAKMLTVY